MTTTELSPDATWNGTREWKPARIRGLRWPALPTMPALAQWIGGAATLTGITLQWGIAVTLITGGVASIVLGALREAGKV